MLRRSGLILTAALVTLPWQAAPQATAGRHPGRTLPGAQAQSGAPVKQGQQAAQAKPGEKPKKPPSLKLAEPWPDAAKLTERRLDAEKRRLFQNNDALPFTLASDFKAVNREREPNSTKRFPGVLTVADQKGGSVSIPVTLRTRGKLRLNPRTCGFVPLSIEFPKNEVKGTDFEDQGTLKLVTHCQNEKSYDQYVLREYLVYKLFNLFTPRSFRARLARATYADSATGKTLSTHTAVFIEDDTDVARRMEGRVVALPRLQFSDLDQESLTLMMLLQYLIGNTDFSIYALHNIRFVQTPAKVFYPITWDFDLSGLVSPPYAVPDPRLNIASVRDRVYRGPCRKLEEFEPLLAALRAKQAEVLALYDSLPDLSQDSRREAKDFLEEFYSRLNRKGDIKRDLVDRCRAQPTM